MDSKEKYFTWSDAWVFAALRGAIDETGFHFASFLATGDLLNHAIMTQEEIKQGLGKLCMRGLVEIDKVSIKKTELADSLYTRADKKRGGLFSVVDNCLTVLNSPRTKLPYIDTTPNLEFITSEYMNAKYNEKAGCVI